MAAAVKKDVELDELEGLNAVECPILCDVEKCVITGQPHCAHPNKGGIQSAHMTDRDIIRRYNRARMMLAQAKAKAKLDAD